jgi:hypothetical protein
LRNRYNRCDPYGGGHPLGDSDLAPCARVPARHCADQKKVKKNSGRLAGQV